MVQLSILLEVLVIDSDAVSFEAIWMSNLLLSVMNAVMVNMV